MKKNRIQDLINQGTEHFIAKFYVMSTIINDDDHASEYHLFIRGDKKNRWCPKEKDYSSLQYFVLKKREIQFFRSVCEESYDTVIQNEDGKIFTHKDIGFNKEGIVPLNNQITIFE